MKTTLELPDDLFIAAKKRAAEMRIPLRRLLERGLRRELEDNPGKTKPTSLKLHTVGKPADGNPPDISTREKLLDFIESLPK